MAAVVLVAVAVAVAVVVVVVVVIVVMVVVVVVALVVVVVVVVLARLGDSTQPLTRPSRTRRQDLARQPVGQAAVQAAARRPGDIHTPPRCVGRLAAGPPSRQDARLSRLQVAQNAWMS